MQFRALKDRIYHHLSSIFFNFVKLSFLSACCNFPYLYLQLCVGFILWVHALTGELAHLDGSQHTLWVEAKADAVSQPCRHFSAPHRYSWVNIPCWHIDHGSPAVKMLSCLQLCDITTVLSLTKVHLIGGGENSNQQLYGK